MDKPMRWRRSIDALMIAWSGSGLPTNWFARQHLMNNLQETLRPIYLTSRPIENTRRRNRPGLNEPCSKCRGIVQTTLALPRMVPCGRVSFARGPAGHQRKEGATAPGRHPL
jgi:hypothetical protein